MEITYLKRLSNSELSLRMERLARTERKITHFVLQSINEVADRNLFAELGYDSLYSYLVKHLGYCESSAYRRIQAARLLKKCPEVSEKLQDGSINLSQLTQVQKSAQASGNKSSEKVREVISRIENKNAFETSRILATEYNIPIQQGEAVKPQRDDSVRLEVTFSKQQFEILQEAKSILSHQCPHGDWAEVISLLAQKILPKSPSKFSQKKYVKPSMTRGLSSKPVQTKTPSNNSRKKIPVQLRRSIFLKANNCCEFIDPIRKAKCGSKYQLQIDHIHPIAMGGSDKPENLRVLCRTHNLFVAEKWNLQRPKSG